MDNSKHDNFNYNIELVNEEVIVIEDLEIEQDEIENIKTFFYSNEILLKLFKHEKDNYVLNLYDNSKDKDIPLYFMQFNNLTDATIFMNRFKEELNFKDFAWN